MKRVKNSRNKRLKHAITRKRSGGAVKKIKKSSCVKWGRGTGGGTGSTGPKMREEK